MLGVGWFLFFFFFSEAGGWLGRRGQYLVEWKVFCKDDAGDGVSSCCVRACVRSAWDR